MQMDCFMEAMTERFYKEAIGFCEPGEESTLRAECKEMAAELASMIDEMGFCVERKYPERPDGVDLWEENGGFTGHE